MAWTGLGSGGNIGPRQVAECDEPSNVKEVATKIIVMLLSLAVLASVGMAQTPGRTAVIANGSGPALFVRFSPDGRELIRICQFGPVEIFDTNGYTSARTFNVGMRMVAYSADGSRLATAEGIDGARVWDAREPGEPMTNLSPTVAGKRFRLTSPLRVLQAPSRDRAIRVFWTEFSPDGKQLITTHADGHVRVWNTMSGALEDEIGVTSAEVRVAAFTPDGKTIVIGDTDGVLHFWSLDKKQRTGKTETPLGAIAGILVAANGKTLVTLHQSSEGSGVMIWGMPPGLAEVWKGYESTNR